MANIKISDLTSAASVADANQFEINEAGTSKKVTGSQIKAYVNASDGALAAKNTVATADIDDLAVTTAKLDADAVDGTKIADDAIDSDADIATGITVMTTLDCGEVDLTWDAGMYEKEPPGDFEGDTPGFWKRHKSLWVGYSPGDLIGNIFDLPPELGKLADVTLINALKSGGGKGIIGKAKNLLRSAVAALLNAGHPDVNYPLSEPEIISAVNAALVSLNEVTMGDLHKALDKFNNLGSDLK